MSLPTLFFDTGIDARGFDRGLAGLKGKASAFSSSLGAILAGATAALGAAAGGAALASQFVQAGAQMEAFEVRLGTLMGSSSEAKARLGELYTYAAQTPFELDQVVAAEVTLRGFGAAAQDVMPGLIDFAATTGAELSQSAIDIGKAWNQGAVGLESDTAKILRKQIELRAGVDATTMSIEDFRSAMLDTLSSGMFAGGAARLSRTFDGMMSNLADSWSGFKREVSDAGLFDTVKDALADTLDLLGENQDKVKEFAGVVSTTLVYAFKGAAYGAAVVVDGVTGIRMGLEFATIGATMLGDAFLTATEPLRQMVILAADGLGMGKATTALMRVDGALGTARGQMRETRQGALEWVDALGKAPSALETVRGIFAEIDVKSENIASNMGGAGDNGGIGSGKAGPTKDEYAAQVEAAYQFAAELNAAQTSAFEAERERQAQLYAEAQVYYDLGITDFATYEAQREQIRIQSEDRMFALDVAAAERERAAHEERLRQIEEEERARRTMMVSGLSTAQSVFGSISGVISTYLEESKAAQKRWGLVSIAIDTAVAVAKAFAQFGWPGGIGPAAEATAQGVAQAAIVAKQHQGGYVMGGAMPDEYDQRGVRRLRQEMTVTLPTHLTRAIDGLSSVMGAGGRGVTEFRIGREMQRELYREGLRTGVFGSAVDAVTRSPSRAGTSRALALA